MNDPQQADATVQVATMTTPGQPLSFKISGSEFSPPTPLRKAAAIGGEWGEPENPAKDPVEVWSPD